MVSLVLALSVGRLFGWLSELSRFLQIGCLRARFVVITYPSISSTYEDAATFFMHMEKCLYHIIWSPTSPSHLLIMIHDDMIVTEQQPSYLALERVYSGF